MSISRKGLLDALAIMRGWERLMKQDQLTPVYAVCLTDYKLDGPEYVVLGPSGKVSPEAAALILGEVVQSLKSTISERGKR